jgi:hemerythrin
MAREHLEWKSDYALGVEDIDFQHHFFLDLINRLVKELDEAADLAYQAALIRELNAYARFHFLSEENMMAHAGYPDLGAHRRHHTELLSQLAVKEGELEMGRSKEAIAAIIDFLIGWFLNHTTVEDRRFSDYLLSRGGA